MALTIIKTVAWVAEINDQPGALASCLGTLAAAGANLECVIGRRRPDKPGRGAVYVGPLKGRKVLKAAAGIGFHPSKRVASLRIEGADRPGLGAKIASAIGAAGVSMRSVAAVAMGRKFVCILGFDSKADANKAAAAVRRMAE